MAQREQFEKLQKEIADDIKRLSDILTKEGIIGDPGPLERASSLCRRQNLDNGQPYWAYTLSTLNFGIIEDDKALKNLRPKGSKNLEVALTLSVKSKLNFVDDRIDPLSRLELNIIIRGFHKNESELICSWHLDRNQGSEVPELVHPRYHFQYGGKEVLNKINGELDFGAALFVEPPRIAHPPMDVVLAVDFILSNFYGKKWQRVLRNPQYCELVQKAQHRFWRPYVFALASHWDNTTKTSWKPKDIWPHLI